MVMNRSGDMRTSDSRPFDVVSSWSEGCCHWRLVSVRSSAASAIYQAPVHGDQGIPWPLTHACADRLSALEMLCLLPNSKSCEY